MIKDFQYDMIKSCQCSRTSRIRTVNILTVLMTGDIIIVLAEQVTLTFLTNNFSLQKLIN